MSGRGALLALVLAIAYLAIITHGITIPHVVTIDGR